MSNLIRLLMAAALLVGCTPPQRHATEALPEPRPAATALMAGGPEATRATGATGTTRATGATRGPDTPVTRGPHARIDSLEPLPPFPPEEFAARRDSVMRRMGGGVALLLGELEPVTHRRFLQDHNFYYLTGVEAPGAAVVLDARTATSHLFLPRQSPQQRQWEGPQLQPGPDAVEATGIENVHPRERLASVLDSLAADAESIWLLSAPPEPPPASPGDAIMTWRALAEDSLLAPQHRNARLIERMRERFPERGMQDLTPIIFELRWAKSPREREYMRRAGLMGALGVSEAIRSTRPGAYEWELAAAATFVQMQMGQQEIAFAPILASGPNVNIIHYTELDRRIEPDDLILLDFGADYGYYTSDVTRTWPADGELTDEQLEFYETAAAVRDSVIAAMRPGVTQQDLLEIARRVVQARGHQDVAWPTTMGYIGHHVGMSVHDPSRPTWNTRPFVPGVVFNVEPILDLPERDWHFRLEDTVLITEDGAEVLTDAAPVRPDEVEALYRETGVVEWWRERG